MKLNISKKLLLIAVISILFSCGSNQQTVAPKNPHVEAHQKMHDDFVQEEINEEFIEKVAGTYVGKIPCADCEAIQYSLELFQDKTYKSTLTYLGKSHTPVSHEGNFTTKGNIIQLDDNAGSMNYFQKVEDGFLLLDKNGKVIEGDLANNYKFIPKTEVSENKESSGMQKILLKKQAENIDFYAIGNEPSWSLDMDFDNVMRFKTLNGIEYSAPAVTPVLAQDHNVKRYRAITESGEIIIQIIQGDCTDTMSGQKFSYQVTVDYKTSKETEYTSFKGCGMYVPDFRLHDIWAIEQVNGTSINPADYRKNAPKLEINVNEQRAFGSDGCNTFRGSVYNEENRLYFGPLASTMMACIVNKEISVAINTVLATKNLTYTIENNRLNLFDKDQKVMVLKHID
jgi:heat shock protein HslJ/uncharacterized membrane protein